MTNTPKIGLWDMDGTILDTEFEVCVITSDLANEQGCATTPEHVMIHHAGYAPAEKFLRIAKECDVALSQEKALEMEEVHETRKAALYGSPGLSVIDGVADALQAMEEEGYLLCVATTARTKNALAALEKSFLLCHFNDRVYGPEFSGGVKKPAPDIFNYALRVNGGSPESAVVVEDTPPGIVAGNAAGIARVIGYLDPRNGAGDAAAAKEAEYRHLGAHVVIRNYKNFMQNL